MGLTTLEKSMLEGIEHQAQEIRAFIDSKDDEIQDFICDTMESDEMSITNMVRHDIMDEIVTKKLDKLFSDIETFKEHRKTRRL